MHDKTKKRGEKRSEGGSQKKNNFYAQMVRRIILTKGGAAKEGESSKRMNRCRQKRGVSDAEGRGEQKPAERRATFGEGCKGEEGKDFEEKTKVPACMMVRMGKRKTTEGEKGQRPTKIKESDRKGGGGEGKNQRESFKAWAMGDKKKPEHEKSR